ncbi:MAG: universal stress protein [Aquisalimonadaceae bacterium]
MDTPSIYSRILMAYDGSESGRKALAQGACVAAQNQAEVHLLAVVRIPAAYGFVEAGYPEHYLDEEMVRIDGVLEEGVALLKSRGLTVHGHRRTGEPVLEIGRLAKELDVDLVVVGHRPRSRLARWWSGSVGNTLLEELDCSMLVAMPKEEAKPE